MKHKLNRKDKVQTLLSIISCWKRATNKL